MITKKLNKIVGLKEEVFKEYLNSSQLEYQNAWLIPLLKTGDERALASIFLSSLRLVKEFRNSVFKDLKFPKSGRYYYLTEIKFTEYNQDRFDGMIVLAKAGKIVDAVIFEMKKDKNQLDPKTIKKYVDFAVKLKIPKFVTITNQYVSNPNQIPIQIKHSKKIELYHFSWTHLITKARILLFKNETNIEDEDQIEIMKEVLHYIEHEKSGVVEKTSMVGEWKTLTENISAHKTIRENDKILESATRSWYQLEKSIALRLSQELGVMVQSKRRNSDSLKKDAKFIIKHKSITTLLSVKNSVSDIYINADFEKKNVMMRIAIDCPEDGTNNRKVSWLINQLESAKKKNEIKFFKLSKYMYLTARIKFKQSDVTEKLSDYDNLKKLEKSDVISGFKLYVVKEMSIRFVSQKKFVDEMENLLLDFYEGYVQHLSNWVKKAPKLEREEKVIDMQIPQSHV